MDPPAPDHPDMIVINPLNPQKCWCTCCRNYQFIVKEKLISQSQAHFHDHRCEWCDMYVDWYNDNHAPKAPQKRNLQKADPDTSYAFTLTMPPTYISKKPLEDIAKLIVVNGLTNKPYEKASRWAFVLEHTESGTPHIHGMYQTPSGRRISNKYFERYHPLWDEKVKLGLGHKGGYHQKTRHNQSYEAYMTKEGCVHSSEK